MKEEEIKIEHGIPIPIKHTGRKPILLATIKKLNVGDSFIWNGKSSNSAQTSVISAFSIWKRKDRIPGIKITTRKVIGSNSVRIWRIA